MQQLTSGPFATNAYLIGGQDCDEALLIDAPPGCYNEVLQALHQSQRHLRAVVITHPHFDHLLDAHLFVQDGIPLFCHELAQEGLSSPQAMGLVPEPREGFPSVHPHRLLKDQEQFTLANVTIAVREVPGHSPGSIALLSSDGPCFVGDLLFRGSVGRTDLPGGDFDVLAESIQNVVYSLPDSTPIYPGHGPSTTVGEEKRCNPYVQG
ncbi:MAG: MBL fold metallo-hydrolase [Spirochaetales bacterium]|nr:MBL fold metallo-hydrolase [Spirochaetales bacterium]